MRLSAYMIVAATLALVLPGVGLATDAPVADKPTEPDARTLLKSIPVVSDADEKIESLMLTASLRIDETVRLECVATYRKPDQRFLSFRNPGSVVPILMATDGRVLVFDSIDQRVLTAAVGGGPLFRLRKPKGKDVEMFWGAQMGDKAALEKPAYLIDIASIFAESEREVTVTRDDKEVTLSGFTPRGAEVRAHLIPGTPLLCHRFEAVGKGEKEPFAVVRIQVNAAADWARFRMPDIDVLKKRLNVVELDLDKGLLTAFLKGYPACVTHIAAVRMYPETPEGRADAEKILKRKVDWDAAKEFDRKVAEALREATKAAAQPVFPGADKLGLTPEQNAKARAWIVKQGGVLSPREFARFLETILDARQRDILREIMKQPTNP